LAKRLTAEYEDEKAARQRAAAPVAGTERFTLVSAADLCNDLL
jgi:hypothetical protein